LIFWATIDDELLLELKTFTNPDVSELELESKLLEDSTCTRPDSELELDGEELLGTELKTNTKPEVSELELESKLLEDST